MVGEALNQYYESISKHPLLSVEEEARLVNLIYKSDAPEVQKKRAKDRLITANLRFVFQSARRRSSKGDYSQFEELVCLGNEGLLEGLAKFDPDRGVRFLSYAGWWVMQHQLRGMAKMRLVAMPIGKQQLAALISKEVEAKGRYLSEEELRERFPTTQVKDLVELQHCKYLTGYIEDLDQHSPSLLTSIEEDILDMIEKEELYQAIRKLSPTEQLLLIDYFGLEDGIKKTPREIAERIEVNADKARRLVMKAVSSLKDILTKKK